MKQAFLLFVGSTALFVAAFGCAAGSGEGSGGTSGGGGSRGGAADVPQAPPDGPEGPGSADRPPDTVPMDLPRDAPVSEASGDAKPDLGPFFTIVRSVDKGLSSAFEGVVNDLIKRDGEFGAFFTSRFFRISAIGEVLYEHAYPASLPGFRSGSVFDGSFVYFRWNRFIWLPESGSPEPSPGIFTPMGDGMAASDGSHLHAFLIAEGGPSTEYRLFNVEVDSTRTTANPDGAMLYAAKKLNVPAAALFRGSELWLLFAQVSSTEVGPKVRIFKDASTKIPPKEVSPATDSYLPWKTAGVSPPLMVAGPSRTMVVWTGNDGVVDGLRYNLIEADGKLIGSDRKLHEPAMMPMDAVWDGARFVIIWVTGDFGESQMYVGAVREDGTIAVPPTRVPFTDGFPGWARMVWTGSNYAMAYLHHECGVCSDKPRFMRFSIASATVVPDKR